MKIRLTRLNKDYYVVIPLCGLSVERVRHGGWGIYQEGDPRTIVGFQTLKECRDEIDSWRRAKEAANG